LFGWHALKSGKDLSGQKNAFAKVQVGACGTGGQQAPGAQGQDGKLMEIDGLPCG